MMICFSEKEKWMKQNYIEQKPLTTPAAKTLCTRARHVVYRQLNSLNIRFFSSQVPYFVPVEFSITNNNNNKV